MSKTKSLSDYNLKSIGDLLELRRYCVLQLGKSVDYLDMVCVFYYVRLLEYVNYLIRLKGYNV